MTDAKPGTAVALEQALSRWDSEGGAGPHGPQDCSIPSDAAAPSDATGAKHPVGRAGRLRDRQTAERMPPSGRGQP